MPCHISKQSIIRHFFQNKIQTPQPGFQILLWSVASRQPYLPPTISVPVPYAATKPDLPPLPKQAIHLKMYVTLLRLTFYLECASQLQSMHTEILLHVQAQIQYCSESISWDSGPGHPPFSLFLSYFVCLLFYIADLLCDNLSMSLSSVPCSRLEQSLWFLASSTTKPVTYT